MDNLPQKTNTFFSKIKKHLYGLFSNKETNTNEQVNNMLDNNNFTLKENKEKFKDNLQNDIKKQKLEESIIQDIEKNPDIIFTLTTDKLEMLAQLYNKKAEEIKKETARILNYANNNS